MPSTTPGFVFSDISERHLDRKIGQKQQLRIYQASTFGLITVTTFLGRIGRDTTTLLCCFLSQSSSLNNNGEMFKDIFLKVLLQDISECIYVDELNFDCLFCLKFSLIRYSQFCAIGNHCKTLQQLLTVGTDTNPYILFCSLAADLPQ